MSNRMSKDLNIKPDFKKFADGLVPAIVQDHNTGKVLMLGFMNQESLDKTIKEKKVSFYSRSRNRLWTKGEESGNLLLLKDISLDCDSDTILLKAEPLGPVCHTGADTCFDEKNMKDDFISYLQEIIVQRFKSPDEKSYVRQLFLGGINKIAQKVGEEAVELIIESKDNNEELFLNEAADLLFHYLILLNAKGYNFDDVISVLKNRHSK
jgi:phosphoribosyl-ATP pyrophosphohydrolase/phosphoribosyl-AMP cyclohydrolase